MPRPIIFLDGLCLPKATQNRYLPHWRESFGREFEIFAPELDDSIRKSAESAVDQLMFQFQRLKDPIVIGYSMGGLWALLLAREGFTKKVALISPAPPSNYNSIDSVRLKIFGSALFSNRPFRFSAEEIQKHIMPDVPSYLAIEAFEGQRGESPRLMREIALKSRFTRLTARDIRFIKENVKGIVFSGEKDTVCPSKQHRDLAEKLGFGFQAYPYGHMLQLGDYANAVEKAMTEFITEEKASKALRLVEERKWVV